MQTAYAVVVDAPQGQHQPGQGACSAVHVAEHERSGQLFAVKMFNAFDKEQRSQMIKEIKIVGLLI